MTEQNLPELLKKYIDGQLNEEEEKLFYQLVEKFSSLEDLDQVLKFLWSEQENQSGKISEDSIARINRVMERVNVTKPKRTKLAIYLPWISAASVIIGIGLVFAMQSIMLTKPVITQKITVAKGQRKKVILADSSIVYLNGGSSISYNQDFNKFERNISLSGEAYFEVAKNHRKPFIIHARELYVKVVGTAFNVSAYGKNEVFKVVVANGRVQVGSSAGKNKKVFSTQLLTAGQKLIFTKDQKLFIQRHTDIRSDLSWKEGLLVLNNNTLDEVATILERWYNVKVELRVKNADKCRFTGSFENIGLHQVLDILKLTSSFSYKTTQQSTIIYGNGCN